MGQGGLPCVRATLGAAAQTLRCDVCCPAPAVAPTVPKCATVVPTVAPTVVPAVAPNVAPTVALTVVQNLAGAVAPTIAPTLCANASTGAPAGDQRLLTSAGDMTVGVWDTQSVSRVATCVGHTGGVKMACPMPSNDDVFATGACGASAFV
eukprot:352766-Chlamydomonas_euryale.AAC.8